MHAASYDGRVCRSRSSTAHGMPAAQVVIYMSCSLDKTLASRRMSR